MSFDPNEVICSLSGLTPTDAELDAVDESNEDGMIPENWTRIKCERRIINQDWLDLQQAKRAAVEAAMAQANAMAAAANQKLDPMARHVTEIQVTALYYALEKETPEFIIEEHEYWFAPGDRDPQLARAIEGFYRELEPIEPEEGPEAEVETDLEEAPIDADLKAAVAATEGVKP